MQPKVVMYRTPYCPYCSMAARLLAKHDVPFEEVDVSGDHERRRWLVTVSGQRTVPQIFINGRSVGGFDELSAVVRRGELPALLAAPPVPGPADPGSPAA
jgi:glutaredoxin 3